MTAKGAGPVGVMGSTLGCDFARVAASIAEALLRHLDRQQQKMMVARTKTTTPPTTAIAIIAPLPMPFLVDLPAWQPIPWLANDEWQIKMADPDDKPSQKVGCSDSESRCNYNRVQAFSQSGRQSGSKWEFCMRTDKSYCIEHNRIVFSRTKSKVMSTPRSKT